MKEEALKLADKLGNPDLCSWQKPTKEASAMIRRLVEELDKKGSSIWDSFRKVYENCQCDSCKNKEPQTKPFPWGDISNEKLIQEVRDRGYKIRNAEIQTKPLSDEEIKEVIRKHWNREYKNRSMFEFAKAIEERHGIK